MLPRENRLRRDRDYRAAYAQGRRYDCKCLVAHVRKTDGAAVRIGFTVGRKMGSAVHRNRVKRLLRESCRLELQRLRPGFDVVFVARACLRSMRMQEVHRSVRDLLWRAGVMVNMHGSEDPIPEGAAGCGGC